MTQEHMGSGTTSESNRDHPGLGACYDGLIAMMLSAFGEQLPPIKVDTQKNNGAYLSRTIPREEEDILGPPKFIVFIAHDLYTLPFPYILVQGNVSHMSDLRCSRLLTRQPRICIIGGGCSDPGLINGGSSGYDVSSPTRSKKWT